MRVLFNENEPYAAGWLRNLYPASEVDDRSIVDVQPRELEGYDRIHLFAGIGGWEHALSLAGWPADRPVWTGSCPCQPFSSAGRRKAEADERHLWPEFRRLVAECRPPTIFGEQVESKDGRRWLAGVRTDLEALGYRFGAADLCAASAGAPHIRQRLYWVADTGRAGDERRRGPGEATGEARRTPSQTQQRERGRDDAGVRGSTRRLADSPSEQVGRTGQPRPLPDGGLEHAEGDGRIEWGAESGGRSSEPRRGVERVAYADGKRGCGGPSGSEDASDARLAGKTRFWDSYDTLPMLDGKTRRIRPGSFPLATGVPARVAKLRAIGNTIVPQVAAAFVTAYLMSQAGLVSSSPQDRSR